MAYCTTAQVQSKYPTAYAQMPTLVAGFIAIADSEIDAVLRGAFYKTPISITVPDIITNLSIDKVGLMMERRLYEHSNDQADANFCIDIEKMIRYVEEGITRKTIRPKIPILTIDADSFGDSLTSPDVSQFKTDICLNTPDINS